MSEGSGGVGRASPPSPGTPGSPFISGATISWFLEAATPGQLAACSGMLARELGSRERSERERPLRQARFPVPKAVEGLDRSGARFPEGWGRDEMPSLDFVGRAEDLVFHGPTGRGKTRVATAPGIGATRRGVPRAPFPGGGAGAPAGQGQARGGHSTGCSPTWAGRSRSSWTSSATSPSTSTAPGCSTG